MRSKFNFGFFFGVLLCCTLLTFGQKPVDCNTKGLVKPQFKIVSSSRGATLVLKITIKPKHQTDKTLISLAKYLPQKYCGYKVIIAQIFANKKDAREFTVYQVKQIPDTERALFYLDRDKGKEELVRVKVVNNIQVETPIAF